MLAESSNGRAYLTRVTADYVAVSTLGREAVEGSARLEASRHAGLSGTFGRYYGFFNYGDYFSSRQLSALTTFSDLLPEVAEKAKADAVAAGFTDDGVRLRDGGTGATAYAEALVTYLAFAIDKCSEHRAAFLEHQQRATKKRVCSSPSRMTWDFVEAEPILRQACKLEEPNEGIDRGRRRRVAPGDPLRVRLSAWREARVRESAGAVVSTDPPYYDNISYADLSDFFFVWLRRNLSDVWPDECAVMTPKADEVIANRYRAGVEGGCGGALRVGDG